MARKKNTVEKFRDRKFVILLYPDNKDHLNALDIIIRTYDHAYILHNQDRWTVKDELINPDHKAGELKKDHFHVIIRLKDNGRWNTALAKELGIDIKFIEGASSLDNSLLYLMHYNDPDKAQYDFDEVYGPLRYRLQELLQKKETTEGERVSDLIRFIQEHDRAITVTEFTIHCASNGYWSDYRRSASIFFRIIEEHNYRYRKHNDSDGVSD